MSKTKQPIDAHAAWQNAIDSGTIADYAPTVPQHKGGEYYKGFPSGEILRETSKEPDLKLVESVRNWKEQRDRVQDKAPVLGPANRF